MALFKELLSAKAVSIKIISHSVQCNFSFFIWLSIEKENQAGEFRGRIAGSKCLHLYILLMP